MINFKLPQNIALNIQQISKFCSKNNLRLIKTNHTHSVLSSIIWPNRLIQKCCLDEKPTSFWHLKSQHLTKMEHSLCEA